MNVIRLVCVLWCGFCGLAGANANAASALTLGVASANAGESVNIPVGFDNSGGVAALQFDVVFDPSRLGAASAAAGSALVLSGHGVAVSLVAANTLRVVITPPAGNPAMGSGNLLDLSFTLLAAMDASQTLVLSNAVMSDAAALSAGVDQTGIGLVAIVGDTSSDYDFDGLPDAWEIGHGLNARNGLDAVLDGDADGLSALAEYSHGSHPLLADSDGDGMADGWEVQYGLDPLNLADAGLDFDNDGISNLDEFLAGSDPSVASVVADVCPSACAHATIQSAIGAAPSWASITVGPGTYREAVVVNKPLTLQSVTGAANTIIDVTGMGQRAITINQAATIDGFTIMGGTANMGGGVLVNAHATLRNNVFRNNSATLSGGGLNVENYKALILEDNVFEANYAANLGGAVCLSAYASQVVNGNLFSNNTATYGGAVATSAYGSDTVKNNLFINNQNAVFLSSYASTKLVNNTFVGNTGYAARKGSYGSMSMINGILWNNTIDLMGWGWSVQNSLIGIDPLFVDAANGNYRLQAASPAVDSGKNVSSLGVYSDHDGVARPRDGDGLGAGATGDGSDYDMGAFEYVP